MLRRLWRSPYSRRYDNAWHDPRPAGQRLREALNKSFDKLRTNGNLLIPFVVSLSNHERNQLVQRFLR